MKLNKTLAISTALVMGSAPVAAQAADSVAPVAERIGATTEAKSENLAGGSGIIIAALAAAAVIAGIIIIADDDDEPTSPG